MKRIDENTYIDDTLVTCAEYQLFIDAKLEQGKYYQPDHWTSYHFLSGQARTPILGVKHSDAVAFCDWLTKREDGEWDFRLPIKKEAFDYQIRPSSQIPVGYWINQRFQFTWIGSDPEKTTRPLRLENIRSIVTSMARTYAQARNHRLVRNLVGAFDRDNFNRNLLRLRDLDRIFAEMIKLAVDRAVKLPISIKDAQAAYTDIHTLQERIAGRSPAFEGIRLVKERIR